MRTALRIIGYALTVLLQVAAAIIVAVGALYLLGCHCPTCPRDGRDYITVPHE